MVLPLKYSSQVHWPLRSFMRTGTFFIGNKKFNTRDEGFMKGYNMASAFLRIIL